MKIAVYGLGQFGYALLKHADINLGEEYLLYGYDNKSDVVKHLTETREHPFLYPGHKISQRAHVSNSPEEVIKDADIIILSVPSHKTRSVLPYINANAKNNVIILNSSKALDNETGKRLSLLFKENLQSIEYKYALFAGGTIAKDLFNSELLGAVIASEDEETAKYLKRILESDHLRLDTTTDLIGVEYASAFKNVISILTGIINGRGYSYGSETFIISKAAKEVEQLIIHELGGKPETFSIGSQCWGNDMFMSATGSTRNREFGILLGKGMTVDEAQQKMLEEKKTVEGMKTIEALHALTDITKYPLLNYLNNCLIKKEQCELLDSIIKM